MNMKKSKLERGIAAYEYEQRRFLRLLRKRGSFTSREFDGWFRGREWRRPRLMARGLTGDTFLLGAGLINGCNQWAEMLELLQMMMALDLVDAKTERGMVVYSLPRSANG